MGFSAIMVFVTNIAFAKTELPTYAPASSIQNNTRLKLLHVTDASLKSLARLDLHPQLTQCRGSQYLYRLDRGGLSEGVGLCFSKYADAKLH